MPFIAAETTRDAASEREELSREGATKFRSVAALANYVALDRPDVQVAVSMLCQKMATSTVKSWETLKRFARRLRKHPALKLKRHGDCAKATLELKVISDGDWAAQRNSLE